MCACLLTGFTPPPSLTELVASRGALEPFRAVLLLRIWFRVRDAKHPRNGLAKAMSSISLQHPWRLKLSLFLMLMQSAWQEHVRDPFSRKNFRGLSDRLPSLQHASRRMEGSDC